MRRLIDENTFETWWFPFAGAVSIAAIFFAPDEKDGISLQAKMTVSTLVAVFLTACWLWQQWKLHRLNQKDPDVMKVYQQIKEHG